MSFDDGAKQQPCLFIEQSTDSRDSGFIEIENQDFTNCGSSSSFFSGRPPMNSPLRSEVLFELDDELDELALDELASGRDDGEAFVASLRELKTHGFTKSANRTFGDITNKMEQDESPKSSHIQRALKPSRLHDFNFSVSRRTSRMHSNFELQSVRKRNLEITPGVERKKKNLKDDDSQENVRGGFQQRDLRSFIRVQSSSAVEIGSFSRVERNQPPQFLQVEYSLETVSKPQIDSVAFKSISGDIVANLMLSMGEVEFFKKFILVDCRYPYEYNGGHLKGAINMFDLSEVNEIFFPDSPERFREASSRIPIFYCEYSQKRGPRMAQALRQIDRKRNEGRYPDVDYKEIYLLDRGYKKFFEEERFRDLCEPKAYTSMVASSHKEDLKRYHLHRSKSTTCLGLTSSSTRRQLCRMRNRIAYSFDDTEMTTHDSHRSLPLPPSPASARVRRANMFGSSFSSSVAAAIVMEGVMETPQPKPCS